jgi:hypothetical protein
MSRRTLVNSGEMALQKVNSSKIQKAVSFGMNNDLMKTQPPPPIQRGTTSKSQSEFYPAEQGGYPVYSHYSMDSYDAVSNYEPNPFAGQMIDAHGRLMRDMTHYVDPDYSPEEIPKFITVWQKPQMTLATDWAWTSPFAFPDIPQVVKLIRMDIFEKDLPKLQIGTIDRKESVEIRNTEEWYPVRSIFFLNVPTPYTSELLLESTGPPRRSKYRPYNKENGRDLSKWNLVTKINAYITPMGIPGSSTFHIDYTDFPDRYFISPKDDPELGNRRLYRFAAYSATQYFIYEKKVHHETLDAEGGDGYTYYIEAGPIAYAKKDWKIIGSFYGFDHQLTNTSQYTIFRRLDPFPRMHIALQNIERSEEWNQDLKFFAYDIPIPGTAKYSLQHCLRSIYSNSASVPRHRLTTEDPWLPWEFRMNIYTFPAELSDCTILPYDIAKMLR